MYVRPAADFYSEEINPLTMVILTHTQQILPHMFHNY